MTTSSLPDTYTLVRVPIGFLVVFGPVERTWAPSRGEVISRHHSYEAAARARRAQENKEKKR